MEQLGNQVCEQIDYSGFADNNMQYIIPMCTYGDYPGDLGFNTTMVHN